MTSAADLSQSDFSFSKAANFGSNESSKVGAEYLRWCSTHHGEPLSFQDPQVYEKMAAFLYGLVGVKIPPFVLEVFKISQEKSRRASRSHNEQRILSEEILRKLEAMRRTSSSASRREFAVLLGEVMSAIYRQFYELLKDIPDDAVLTSMAYTSTSSWGTSSAASTLIPSIDTLAEKPTVVSVDPSNVTLAPIRAVEAIMDILPQKPAKSPGTIHYAHHDAHTHHTPEENVIEIQFTLNGLANGRDALHSLHPVLSGTSIVQEPTVDTGEHCHRSKGLRHAGWKRLRRIGRSLQQAFSASRGSGLSGAESMEFRYGFADRAVTAHASRLLK